MLFQILRNYQKMRKLIWMEFSRAVDSKKLLKYFDVNENKIWKLIVVSEEVDKWRFFYAETNKYSRRSW